jgi:DNA-binding XRE family transcriptional regulator
VPRFGCQEKNVLLLTISLGRGLLMTEKTVPDILRAWRHKHHLSQEEAASFADCSLSCWRNWETGRADISAETISALEKEHPGLWEALAKARP